MGDRIIERFEIKGLFNYETFNATISDDTTIYIGENGMGKTTVMSILFYLLKGDLLELFHYQFDSISIDYTDGVKFSLQHDEIEEYVDNQRLSRHRDTTRRIAKYLERDFTKEQMRGILEEFTTLIKEMDNDFQIEDYLNSSLSTLSPVKFKLKYPLVTKAFKQEKMPAKIFIRSLRTLIKDTLEEESSIRSFLADNELRFSNTNILYFPTYRRIEEDFNQLFTTTTDEDNRYNLEDEVSWHHIQQHKELLQFGMKDVDKIFFDILNSIRSKSIESFNELNGVLLKQYLSNHINETLSSSKEELLLSLDRIGDKISHQQKEQVIEKLFTSPENNMNSYLVNYMENLVENYKKTQPIDNKIKGFISTINNYLYQKTFQYDASTLAITLVNDITGEKIELKDLSSGEKQIVAIFAKILLSQEEHLIVLFDEPELSISIEWQGNLITDIRKAENLDFLMAVTHSPFIFKEESILKLTHAMGDNMTSDGVNGNE